MAPPVLALASSLSKYLSKALLKVLPLLSNEQETIKCCTDRQRSIVSPRAPVGAKKKYISMYRVFFFILIQECACCELILGLLRSQIGSLGPQDWAQITFR